MIQPHITWEYIESLSIENAVILQRMVCAQYSETNGEGISVAENVSMQIEFAIRNSQHERSESIY